MESHRDHVDDVVATEVGPLFWPQNGSTDRYVGDVEASACHAASAHRIARTCSSTRLNPTDDPNAACERKALCMLAAT